MDQTRMVKTLQFMQDLYYVVFPILALVPVLSVHLSRISMNTPFAAVGFLWQQTHRENLVEKKIPLGILGFTATILLHTKKESGIFGHFLRDLRRFLPVVSVWIFASPNQMPGLKTHHAPTGPAVYRGNGWRVFSWGLRGKWRCGQFCVFFPRNKTPFWFLEYYVYIYIYAHTYTLYVQVSTIPLFPLSGTVWIITFLEEESLYCFFFSGAPCR